jgi:hypothetical protein
MGAAVACNAAKGFYGETVTRPFMLGWNLQK